MKRFLSLAIILAMALVCAPANSQTVSLPNDNFYTGVPVDTVIIEPVITSAITPTFDEMGNCTDNCFIGFQGEFTYDSTVVDFPYGVIQGAAGMTGNGWTVGVCKRDSGGGTNGTIKKVEVSAFSLDGLTPLSGSGVLFNLTMYRVNSTPGLVT